MQQRDLANLALATLNDMLCGEDGERGDDVTIRAAQKLLTERDEARAAGAKT